MRPLKGTMGCTVAFIDKTIPHACYKALWMNKFGIRLRQTARYLKPSFPGKNDCPQYYSGSGNR